MLSNSYNILLNILFSRLIPYADEIIGDHQGEFRHNRSMTAQIFFICKITWEKRECNGTVHQLFIDFKKAYDLLRKKVFYNIRIKFGIPRKLVRLIKICLNEAYTIVRIDKNLSNKFPIQNDLKKWEAFSPLLFNFALVYAISRVQRNQEGLKLNETHQLSAYVGDVYVVKENTEALLYTSKEFGLSVNPEKTKCVLMSRSQQAGQKYSTKTANKSFEDVVKFRYLGTTLTEQNCTHDEIKSRLNSGNACYHSVQSLLFSHLLFSNIKVKM
jgi:hypothetical protein